MIFVTIGTGAFPRLITKMDEIAGKTNENVVMQIGCTKYIPQNAEYFEFLNFEDMVDFIRKSRVVVCHDGAGSIMTVLQLGKPVIAVPRLKRYGELFYENSGEFIKELIDQGLTIKAIYDIGDIEAALRNTDSTACYLDTENQKKLVSALKEYINQLQKQKVGSYQGASK
ncbi:glycosyltransferase [Chloroflexota bacterium]